MPYIYHHFQDYSPDKLDIPNYPLELVVQIYLVFGSFLVKAPFAKVKAPFARVKAPFAKVKDPFARGKAPFARVKAPFDKFVYILHVPHRIVNLVLLCFHIFYP
jgi:hypothetical protein